MTKKTTMIKNAELYWTKLDEPVAPFGTPLYDVQIRVDKETQSILEYLGLKFRNEDGVMVTNVTRNASNAKGEAVTVPVVDGNLNPVDTTAIGNGSKANLKLFTYPYETKDGRKGTKTILMGVQVTELKAFEPQGMDFDVIS